MIIHCNIFKRPAFPALLDVDWHQSVRKPLAVVAGSSKSAWMCNDVDVLMLRAIFLQLFISMGSEGGGGYWVGVGCADRDEHMEGGF